MKQGWEVKKLGQVFKLEYGKPLTEQKRAVDGSYPMYGANGVKGHTNEFLYNQKTIIVGRKGSAGEINLSEEKFWPLDVTYYLTFDSSKYDLKFLFHLLTLLDLPKLATGVKPGINRNDVYRIMSYFPSLCEQQHIVAILDKAFDAIARAKANAEQNLNEARELFESYLQSVFENKGEGWGEKALSEICEVKDGTHDSPKYVKEGVPFVTQKNIRQNGLSFAETKFISREDHNKFYKRSNVTFGDILISMIGANRGMACIVDDKRVFSIKNVGLIKESNDINKFFLLYYFKSPIAMDYVKFMSNGGAQEFVGLTALRSFPIPMPEIKEQENIVQKLDALSTETKKLEAIYQRKIADLDELKKSLLQKTFNGELKTLEPISA